MVAFDSSVANWDADVETDGVVTWTRPAKEDHRALGLVYDGAYWLDGVNAKDPAKLGTITVESNRIPHS